MNEEKIVSMLMDHEERLERIEQNMATKQDIRNISSTLDILVKYAYKNDGEIAVLAHNQKQMQNDIDRIKPLVGLV